MACPDFSHPCQSGQCPACDHSGEDCHCHRNPKRAAKKFIKKELLAASQRIAIAQQTARQYNVDEKGLGLLLGAYCEELGSSYLDPSDRFVVSFVVGVGPGEGAGNPEQAVAAALDLINGEGSEETQWFCFDRNRRVMHVVLQGAADRSVDHPGGSVGGHITSKP